MKRGVAERDLTGLGATIVKMDIVFPSESHAAMHLDSAIPRLAIRFAGIRLRDTHRKPCLRPTLLQRPRSVVSGRTATLGEDQHVGAHVLHRLKLSDRHTELLACLGVGD